MLATYGLRVHEAWNIANWDNPVTLKNGNWIIVDVDGKEDIELQRNNGDLIIPAVLDPTNKEYLLCINNGTKTGYRITFPLSPEGRNWTKEFDLLQDLNLPDIPNPLRRSGKRKSTYACTNTTDSWFERRDYGFTPHDLRHAYNHRGHQLGVNPKALADSLGHSMAMNTIGYLKHMSNEVKLQGIKDAIQKEQNKRSENELLKEKVKDLKAQLEAAKNRIELLETKLQLNNTYQQSDG